jgi:molybdenum cofactor cytidylyltransferase/nicotine blue oxidoreductase
MQAAAVILAAGGSTRFGSPKQLARLGNRTMLETVVELAHNAGLAPVIAVIRPGITTPASVMPVVNEEPVAGLSRSLRLGLAAVPPKIGAALILLGDQPTVPAGTLRALVEAAALTARPVVASLAEGRLGPPVVLLREAFALADEATGDEGLRRILEAHSDLVSTVEVGEHAPDVDTPADLSALGDGRA